MTAPLILTAPNLADGAACRTVADPDAFYPETWGRAAVSDAVEMCSRCPVRLKCLAWALENDEQHGIWGGTTEPQRRRMRKKARINVAEKQAGIRDLHAKGMNDAQIARELGVSNSFVGRHRNNLGLPSVHENGNAEAAARRAKIAELHAQGMRDCEIAPALGITRQKVKDDRKKLNLDSNHGGAA